MKTKKDPPAQKQPMQGACISLNAQYKDRKSIPHRQIPDFKSVAEILDENFGYLLNYSESKDYD